MSKELWKCLGAEFLGTFILMFVSVGSGLYVKEEYKPSLVAIALTWGLSVATLAQTLGHISGCHMNPAVTIGMLATKKINFIKATLYIITQCISSISAIMVLRLATSEKCKGGYGVLAVSEDLTKLQGFSIEFLSTFILLLTIFAVSDENREDVRGSAPLAIGFCVTMLIFLGAEMTGTGLNPARALGPAVVMGAYQDQWVYWFAPIGGALCGALLYEHCFRNPEPEELDLEFKDQQSDSQSQSQLNLGNNELFSCY